MPRLPLVAIIGRPNTGKSSLFNRLLGERRAIVSDVPGTTRDHVAGRMDHTDSEPHVEYVLLDTGGMGGGTGDADIEKDVHAQSLLALDAANVIVFTVDGKEEITRSDREIADILRRRRKRHVPVILAITKCDTARRAEERISQYHELGIGDDVIAVSAAQGLGILELEDSIVAQLRELHFGTIEQTSKRMNDQTPQIAVVGKPNVGKSSLINALMSAPERRTSPRLVSPLPGTTRDATDTIIRAQGQEYVFIDTAGLKRHAQMGDGIEYYAFLRSVRALQEADVAVLVLEALEPISRQDKRIAGLVVEAGTGLVLLLNKIDLLSAKEKKEKLLQIGSELPFCRFAPLLPASATTREGLLKLFPLLDMCHRNRLRRIPERELHRWLSDALHGKPMAALATAKHITQAEDPPPTFVLFVRDPKRIQVSQLRYLENRLRETFGFEGTPVRWVTKKSGRRTMEN